MKLFSSMLQRSSSLAAIFMLLFSGPLLAEQFVSHGNYEIHYNAFNSTFVEPKVAQQAGLTRSKRMALINVSVLQDIDGKKVPVTAVVKGQAKSLIQQIQQISFTKIDEGNAIYYLGEFGFTDDQVLRLQLEVQPDPNASPYTIKFEQRFYAD